MDSFFTPATSGVPAMPKFVPASVVLEALAGSERAQFIAERSFVLARTEAQDEGRPFWFLCIKRQAF
jgi:hypothetical protein